MAETNGDVKKCPRCHHLENKLRECSEILRVERIDPRGARAGRGNDVQGDVAGKGRIDGMVCNWSLPKLTISREYITITAW